MLYIMHHKKMTVTSKQPVLIQLVIMLTKLQLLLCSCKYEMCNSHDCLHSNNDGCWCNKSPCRAELPVSDLQEASYRAYLVVLKIFVQIGSLCST